MALEMNDDGTLIIRPVMGWTTGPASGKSVILLIRYARTLSELDQDPMAIQVALIPQQAQELAEELSRQAQHVLQSPWEPE